MVQKANFLRTLALPKQFQITRRVGDLWVDVRKVARGVPFVVVMRHSTFRLQVRGWRGSIKQFVSWMLARFRKWVAARARAVFLGHTKRVLYSTGRVVRRWAVRFAVGFKEWLVGEPEFVDTPTGAAWWRQTMDHYNRDPLTTQRGNSDQARVPHKVWMRKTRSERASLLQASRCYCREETEKNRRDAIRRCKKYKVPVPTHFNREVCATCDTLSGNRVDRGLYGDYDEYWL